MVVGACGKETAHTITPQAPEQVWVSVVLPALPVKVRVLSLKGHSGTTCLTDRPSSSHFFLDSCISKGTVWRWENLFFILKIVFLYYLSLFLKIFNYEITDFPILVDFKAISIEAV